MSLPRRQIPISARIWVPGSPLGVKLIVAALGGFGATQALLWAFGIRELTDSLVLDPGAVRYHEYWRFFTHQFLHVNFVHFLVNSVVLYFAGREVEPIIGRRHFLSLCVISGLIGGVVSWFTAPYSAVFGCSAMVAAVLAAYSTILPELEQRVALFFIIPLRFRAKFFALAAMTFAAVCLATRTLGEAGPAGMLVGGVLGWLWARRLGFGNQFWWQRRASERRHATLRRQRMTPDEFITKEVDPILEKISREGIRSLTHAEKCTLNEGSAKVALKPARKI
jgi:membrane associated rhomboid family serine protease